MLITTGKVASREPWRILEVAMNQAPDVLAVRIHKQLKLMHESAQALIPMRRNVNGDAEWIIEHIYVRGLNGSLGRLARTPGIDFIRSENAEQEWIDTLMNQNGVVSPIKTGDFVRVLTGPCARLCGHVTGIKRRQFAVSVSLPTKRMMVYASADNLQVIDCPPEEQTFYYQQI